MNNNSTLTQDSLFLATSGNNLNYNDWYNPGTYNDCIHTFYQPYISHWETDRTGKAMRLIQTLIEKKVMKEPKTVGAFIEIVNEVSKLL